MKKQYIFLVAGVVGVFWSSEMDGQQVYAKIHRGINTDCAAIVFIKETITNAAELKTKKGDSAACAECLVKFINNFANLVMAIRQDEEIEDSVQAQKNQHRSYNVERLSDVMNDVHDAFSAYVHSPEGLAELDNIFDRAV